MSVGAIHWAFQQNITDPTAKLILLVLADSANEDERGALISNRTLQEKTSLARRTIWSKINILEPKYIQRVVRIRDNGMQDTNFYHLKCFPSPNELANSAPPDFCGFANSAPPSKERKKESSLRSVSGSGRETPEGKDSEPERRESTREQESSLRHSNEAAKKCFEIFWASYPNKVGKKKCLPKYIKILRDKEASHAEVMAGLERYKKNKPFDRAWCNPETWLNQARWEDEPAAPGEGRRSSINEVMGVRR